MTTNYRKTIANILIIIALFLLGYFLGKSHVVKPDIKEQEVRIDTIYKEIKGKDSIITKYKDRVKIIKENTPSYPYECEPIVEYKDSIINIQDTIIMHQDTIIYKYDTIVQIQKEIIHDFKKPSKKIDFGIIAGYGATKDGLSPFAGVGISFNPFRK